MRTIQRLVFIVILGAVICALIMLGSSSQNALAAGKPDKPDNPGKPDKPEKPGEEEATWAVRIPTQTEATLEGLKFYGMDSIDGKPCYLNNDKDIEVSVKKEKMSGPWKKYYNLSLEFKFSLINDNAGTGVPPKHFVGFQDVGELFEMSNPDPDKPCCQFPAVMSDPPDCMADFLNNTHPYSITGNPLEDYEFFLIWPTIFDFDIELMIVGEHYLMGSSSDPGEPGDLFFMQTQYRQGCQKEPAFHNVRIDRTVNYSHPANIWIERLDEGLYALPCEKVWRMHISNEYLCLEEFYCTRDKGQTFYTPLKAKGYFSFYIDWIKNPN
jgi:hypothetical protein